MNKQSSFYESVGDRLTGKKAERAFVAAQNHLNELDDKFMENFRRIQNKIISTYEG